MLKNLLQSFMNKKITLSSSYAALITDHGGVVSSTVVEANAAASAIAGSELGRDLAEVDDAVGRVVDEHVHHRAAIGVMCTSRKAPSSKKIALTFSAGRTQS